MNARRIPWRDRLVLFAGWVTMFGALGFFAMRDVVGDVVYPVGVDIAAVIFGIGFIVVPIMALFGWRYGPRVSTFSSAAGLVPSAWDLRFDEPPLFGLFSSILVLTVLSILVDFAHIRRGQRRRVRPDETEKRADDVRLANGEQTMRPHARFELAVSPSDEAEQFIEGLIDGFERDDAIITVGDAPGGYRVYLAGSEGLLDCSLIREQATRGR